MEVCNYALDLLNEIVTINCKPVETILIPNKKYSANMESKHVDDTSYKRTAGKLNYLTIIKQDITLAVEIVSQFMQKSK